MRRGGDIGALDDLDDGWTMGAARAVCDEPDALLLLADLREVTTDMHVGRVRRGDGRGVRRDGANHRESAPDGRGAIADQRSLWSTSWA